jgi:hypothetical protein
MKSVWQISAPERDEKRFGKHPTQKPVALLERILLAASNEGDLVLDPFMGSGTALVAALMLRRAAVAVERDLDVVGLGLTRVLAELVQVTIVVASYQAGLDLRRLSMDRSMGWSEGAEVAESCRLVYRERKFHFVGSSRREIVYSVAAPSLEEAWREFRSSSQAAEEILTVVKTETEIYLAQ